MSRFLVEGAYLDGNDGSNPITGDYVAAKTAGEAGSIVYKVRSKTGDWMLDSVVSFEEHIKSERERLDRMEHMSEDNVRDNWETTKQDLYYEEDKDDAGECPVTCVLTGAEGEDPDDCTTHDHE